MRYTQVLLDQATGYVARSLPDKRSPAGLAELAQLYADVTGVPVGSCRQCQYSDFVSSLTSYIREATRALHPETMSTTKYMIVAALANETFVHEDYNKAVTAENMTDKDAEFLRAHGFESAIVLKDGSTPATPTNAQAGTSEVTTEKPLVPQADLDAEAAAHGKTKEAAKLAATKAREALTAEKTAHTATKKELTTTQKQLSELQEKLVKSEAALAEATKPAE